jgi:hypothetical protein
MGKLKDNLAAAKAVLPMVDRVMGASGGAPNKEDEISASIQEPFDPIDFVQTLGIGAAIKHQNQVVGLQAKLEQKMGLIRDEFFKAYPRAKPPAKFTWTKQMLLDLAKFAKKHQAGQCTEQVALAFQELRNQGVAPLDLMVLSPQDMADHTFLVIGRQIAPREPAVEPNWDVDDKGAPPWGPDAVVCDPWSPDKKNRAYPAAELRARMTMHRWWGVKSVFRWTGS